MNSHGTNHESSYTTHHLVTAASSRLNGFVHRTDCNQTTIDALHFCFCTTYFLYNGSVILATDMEYQIRGALYSYLELIFMTAAKHIYIYNTYMLISSQQNSISKCLEYTMHEKFIVKIRRYRDHRNFWMKITLLLRSSRLYIESPTVYGQLLDMQFITSMPLAANIHDLLKHAQ